MNIEELREFCLSIKGASESLPFDAHTLVFKVMDKMFAVIPLDQEGHSITVKCNPDKAVELREQFDCIVPAWHFNKKYWNTIYLNKTVGPDEIKKWILHSVDEVILKLPKRIREEYKSLPE